MFSRPFCSSTNKISLIPNELCNSILSSPEGIQQEDNFRNQKEENKMLISFSDVATMRKLSFFIFVFCVLISINNQNAEKGLTAFRWLPSSSTLSSPESDSESSPAMLSSDSVFLSIDDDEKLEEDVGESNKTLEYDFYRDSCPQAEEIVHSVVKYLYKVRSDVAPALLRLLFHDCFIEGCDASVLLDATDQTDSEKDSPPNETLKGFDIIDIIKEELEQVCPGIVSCADILALAAREGVAQAGGPFYPLYTGRRDSMVSFSDVASYELPSPNADLSESLASFASRGFDLRETVTLLGAHGIGVIRCQFFRNRLYNFGGTNQPDPSLDPDFLSLMRSKCNNNKTHTSPTLSPSPSPSSNIFSSSPSPLSPSPSSSSPSPSSPSFFSPLEEEEEEEEEEPGMEMAYEEGPSAEFGAPYYRSLLQSKGILYADQQLMAGEETGVWVRAYASDLSLFRKDFALVMMKLSNLRVLTGSMGQIRHNCSKVA